MSTRNARSEQARDDAVSPGNLHLILPIAATVVRSFGSEKELTRFRSLVYSINKQGEHRYRTIRAENEMWALVIWRML